MRHPDTTTGVPTGSAPTGERADLLATLTAHRNFLRQTLRGLTDEQAGRRNRRAGRAADHRQRAVPGRAGQARRRDRVGVGRLHRGRPGGDGRRFR